ncbi:hypothetical protein A9267_17675 [Shewanella sp. UCD-FRSSP16_17]|uniref:hypothetical protein n=1 Tax=Shewanella sp. UCD-FRSSP16_17 TaxID=1853256 RepID=UPI0007EE9D3D|nr:hypothetical protein [Shewanella sp. UCD-FRSSP16_17]OBT04770.1 hypothetical protein A9267_17675 [Shewanella sp. UCD-FRSSP16_17]
MEKYSITKSILEMAQSQLDDTPVWEGSHRGEAANQVGVLGEIVVEQWLKSKGISFKDDRELTTHDYTLRNGETFDVKTKDRTVVPRTDYDCSVPLYNHSHQRPDYYIFVSLERDRTNKTKDLNRFHTAYILGGINIKQLESRGVIWKEGQTDPANGTTFWTDCINVKVEQLATHKEVTNKWRSL